MSEERIQAYGRLIEQLLGCEAEGEGGLFANSLGLHVSGGRVAQMRSAWLLWGRANGYQC